MENFSVRYNHAVRGLDYALTYLDSFTANEALQQQAPCVPSGNLAQAHSVSRFYGRSYLVSTPSAMNIY